MNFKCKKVDGEIKWFPMEKKGTETETLWRSLRRKLGIKTLKEKLEELFETD